MRARARRALAELAYISCVVSDTGRLPAEQVRERVLCASELETPKAAAEGKGARGRKRK